MKIQKHVFIKPNLWFIMDEIMKSIDFNPDTVMPMINDSGPMLFIQYAGDSGNWREDIYAKFDGMYYSYYHPNGEYSTKLPDDKYLQLLERIADAKKMIEVVKPKLF